jgi:hypothetical protein
MEIFFEEILKNKNNSIIEEKYKQENHLILSKYTSKKYYKYSIDLLKSFLEKISYTNKTYIFHMSLQYLIKIIYNFKNISYIDNYDLFILCSFLLGIKVSINQYNPPFITEIKRKYSNKYSSYSNEEIQKYELTCMKLLDYNINILTPYECIYYLFYKDQNILSIVTKELENIIYNDLNSFLFKKPYELAQEAIYKTDLKTHNIKQSLLIIKKKKPITKIKGSKIKIKVKKDTTPTTSMSSSNGSKNNTNRNINNKKAKAIRSQSNEDVNNKSIINNINKELDHIYKNNNFLVLSHNNSANKDKIKINHYPVCITVNDNKKENYKDDKKVIYINTNYINNNVNIHIHNKKNIIGNNKTETNSIENKLIKNSLLYKSKSGYLRKLNNSTNENLISRNEAVNVQKMRINKYLCFSNNNLPVENSNNKKKEFYNDKKINENDLIKNKSHICKDYKLLNSFSSINLNSLRIQNSSINAVFKKPILNKNEIKSSFKVNNEKNIKNNKKINYKQAINFDTAIKNYNIHFRKISDLCKKINFDVFNNYSDKIKLEK